MDDNKDANQDLGASAKVGASLLGIILWCSSGGLMLAHFVSWFLGYTSTLYAIGGFFIAPYGIVNGAVFIFTGNSLEQYF